MPEHGAGEGMIIGSGLIARAFFPYRRALSDICVYAAGISNSACNDSSEFLRDRERLQQAISVTRPLTLFIYFGTCSIADPSSQQSRYVAHKCELEELVRELDRYLVVRLPQVAGVTPNPHTILNYLYARISRSERFDLWRTATRNVIDVEDVTCIVLDLMLEERACRETINVASKVNSTMFEIVAAIEQVTGRRAIYDLVERGGAYSIDISRIQASIRRCKIIFDETYLLRTIEKYYGRRTLAGP
jgi:nucleoside-diphosphate-sugar epimerase